MLQVHHFYHTTPEHADDSPFRATGFHTLFYPQFLLNKEDLYRIEQWIQIPLSGQFLAKEVFFFTPINGRAHLVLLAITRLPEASDHYGRSNGVYQCHGAIAPPEVWTQLPTPLALRTLVRPLLFPDREAAFASSLVNHETGNMTSWDFPEEALSTLVESYQMLQPSPFHLRVILLFRRLAGEGFRPGRLLIHGTLDEVESLLDCCCLLLPKEMWGEVSFDPVLDGILLHPLPVRVVGYLNQQPRGGNPIDVYLEERTIEGEVVALHATPLGMFEQWLADRDYASLPNASEITKIMTFCHHFDKREAAPSGGELPSEQEFLSWAATAINERFGELCTSTFGSVVRRFHPFLSYPERVVAVARGLTPELQAELKIVLTAAVEKPAKAWLTLESQRILRQLFSGLFRKG